MKREFDLSATQSQDFLRYFKASIRNPKTGMIHGDGQGRFKDDFYETEQSVSFEYKGKKLFVAWKVIQYPDGRLKSIENTSAVGDTTEFDKLLTEFISDIFEKVINRKKEKFFQRTYLTTVYDETLQGEYWIEGFRFAPLFPDDDCTLINAERIFVIDQSIEAVDRSHATEIARRNSSTIASYLSFILDLGLDEPEHEVKYFLHKEKDFEMLRNSTQLIDTNFPEKMPKKGEHCPHVTFEGSIYDTVRNIVGQPLTCPTETRKIFRKVSEASEEIQEAFNSASRMYQLALILGKRRPSIRAAYQYGAIDSIIQSNKKKYKGFTVFMSRYADANKDLCELIHSKIRSAHWHAGHLPLGEMRHELDTIYEVSAMPITMISMEIQKIMRLALINWLDEQIAFSK